MTYQDNSNGEIISVVEPDDETVVETPNSMRWIWWLLGLLVLAGLIWGLTRACQPQPHAVAPEPVPPVATLAPLAEVTLDCDGTPVQATVYPEHIEATISTGERLMLPEAEAASGARYTNNQVTLWEHQGEWLLIHNEGAANEQQVECTTH